MQTTAFVSPHAPVAHGMHMACTWQLSVGGWSEGGRVARNALGGAQEHEGRTWSEAEEYGCPCELGGCHRKDLDRGGWLVAHEVRPQALNDAT